MLRLYEVNWYLKLGAEFNKVYFQELEAKLEADKKAGKLILPLDDRIFRAFDLTPLPKVNVVILGQDPYINLKQATGLAFSVPPTEKVPATLRNMLKELKSDYGIVKESGDLTFWATQGVFLLNTTLTVESGKSGSHAGYGWDKFTDQVIKVLAKEGRPMVYWLLGNHAHKKEDLINVNSSAPVLIIKTPHPSPLSAYRGFFWSKPYSKTNAFLATHNVMPINWSE
jgi:uracil-DNA glycosylase